MPYQDVASLRATALATKEAVDILTGQTGEVKERAVTWADLLRLGLVTPPDLPND